jgi:ABC-type multidrug transport system permease subunit
VACLHGVSSGSTDSPFAIAAISLAAVCLVGGWIIHRPPVSVTATSLLSIFFLVTALSASLGELSASTVESLVLASQLILVAGLVVFVRNRLGQRASSVLPDGLIVGLGAWVLIWVVLVQPAIQESTSSSLTIL